MSKAQKLCFAFSDKVEIKWSAMNGMGESFPTVYVNGKIDKEKTKNLRLAIAKVGWANLKDLAPELIAELVGVNDVKTLLDSDASFSKQSLSFLSLLLTYFPAKKAVNLYKAMEAARLLEKGGDLALDLAKISKTFGLTEKEAKVLNEMWEAEKVSSKFSSELEMLDPNKINHIMLSKHDWIKVVNPPTWENVKPLMEEVLKKGKDTVVKEFQRKN